MADVVTRLLLNTRDFNRNLQGAKKQINGFRSSMASIGKSVGPVLGQFAAFAGVSMAISDVVRTSMEFEKALSSLKSLTGVTTQELSFFKEEAIRLGSTTTQTASQVVDAFKLIGSQMPELLKSKEALTRVTESAIVLAEAAGLDVPTAAKALTGSLNQMGQSALHANEYINILAAASQQGSADIPYLNRAIEKAGGAASSVGVEFNELVAAIEAIAPKVTEASEAGTQLRNIFLTLESSTDRNLKPSVVGLSKALDNLVAKKLDATQMTKLFGKESVTAALALTKENETFKKLTGSITGTNTAFEQQRINNDNLAGSILGLQSAWEGFTLSLNNSNGALKGVVDWLTSIVNKAREAITETSTLLQQSANAQASEAVKESNKRISADMSAGISKENALKEEEARVSQMYAQYSKEQLEELKKQFEVAERNLKTSNMSSDVAYRLEQDKVYKAAKAAYITALNEGRAREAVLNNIKEQRAELERIAQLKDKYNAQPTPTPTPVTPTTETTAAAGSIAALDAEIKKAQQEYASAASDAARIAAHKTLRELEGKRVRIEFQVKHGNVKSSSMKGGHGLAALAGLPEGWDKIEPPFTGKDVKGNQNFADSMMAVADSFGALGAAAQNMGDSALAGMMTSMGAIAQMIVQLHGLTVANGVAKAAELPFPANLAAIATVVSTVATVFSSLPKFANGGIVSGSSMFGDHMLARVNSGEMILNQTQQGNLFRLANGGGIGGGQVTVGGEAKVNGKTMYLAIRNYMKANNKHW